MKSTIYDILNKLFVVLFIISIPLLTVSSSIAISFNNPSLYRFGYEKCDVVRETGFDIEQLDYITHEIIDYFNDTESSEDLHVVVEKNNHEISLFREREVIHMKDVKGLVQLDYSILRICLILDIVSILYFILFKQYKLLSKALIISGLITLGIMLIIGIIAAIDFYDLFVFFHTIAFDNDYWLLSFTDYLIMLFPENFWVICLFNVILIIVIEVLIITLLGFILKKKIS